MHGGQTTYCAATTSDIHTLIDLGRRGSSAQGFRPVYVYANVAKRRAIIPGYANKTWVSSGQKRAFQKNQFFAIHVAESNSAIEDSFKAGSDSEWGVALSDFKARWDLMRKNILLLILE